MMLLSFKGPAFYTRDGRLHTCLGETVICTPCDIPAMLHPSPQTPNRPKTENFLGSPIRHMFCCCPTRRMMDLFRHTPRRLPRFAIALLSCTPLWACASNDLDFVPSREVTDTQEKTATLPPLASAGPDREVLRGYRTQLDATGTWSLDDASLTLSWQQSEGEPVYLSNPNDATPYFIAPLDEQTIKFVLTVTNGAFTVKDEVAVFVKNEPARVAPVVNGGPDQVGVELDTNAGLLPSFADGAGGIEVSWEEVTPDRAALATTRSANVMPRIFKLVGVRDGLSSAPDYVLLHAPREDAVTPPVSSAEGPAQAATGSTIVLAASGSSNAGKRLSYHWEQTRGAPVLQTLGAKASQLDIAIPRVSQQLVFRVHAYDGLLASAPSEIILEVLPGDGLHPGQLVPGSDVRARPGSSVTLRASAENATPGAELDWQQTRGSSVSFEQSDGHIVFSTPESADELAFVVSSKIDDAESNPAAYRIVVTDEGNSAPCITACVPTDIIPGEPMEVSVRFTDPDGDTFSELSATVDGSALTEVAGGTVTGECAKEPSAAAGSSVTRVYTLDAPAAGTSVTLHLAATDARGDERTVSVDIEP